MAEIIVAATDSTPLIHCTINGVDHSKTAGVAFTPTAAELSALQQSHYADNITSAALRNLTVPTITGTAQSGQTLTGHHGTYNNDPIDYTYQWYADGVAISGATGITRVLAAGQIGAVITFVETARDLTGTAVGASAGTAAVIA